MTQDIMPPEVLEKLTPEFVAPVVAYLCTEECADNGSVFVVGGGKVQRVALFGNDGVNFEKPPTVADVAAQWTEITDLSGAQKPVSRCRVNESLCRKRAFRPVGHRVHRYRRRHR